jgi:hypothetical protein
MPATTRAFDHLLRATGDPVAELAGIAPGDPGFARATVLRVAAGVIAKTPRALPGIAAALRAAGGLELSGRTRAHLAAAEAWLDGDPVLAAERYRAMLDRWPRDLMALRLAESCYFFLGRHAALAEAVAAVWPAWRQYGSNFGFVLAMAAFARAENGDAERAEALGREALRRNPACPMGVHAVAHAIAESGRNQLGAQWMREQAAQWAGESRMRSHNAWHLAMFDADDGNLASALGILDAWLLPAAARSPLDACDAAALMWRLAEDGVADAGRWRRISDAFARCWTGGFWPYVDLHAALAHWSAGEARRAWRLEREIEAVALGDDYAAARARRITQPGLQALAARAGDRHAEALRSFAQLRPLLDEAGGSRIQLEIFRRIERDSARRAGDAVQRRAGYAAVSAARPRRGALGFAGAD